MLMILASSQLATAGNDPLKPYVVLVLDTSGSMNEVTGSGPPSCGGKDTKLDHARCAINKIANSYGEMVFALGRFRNQMGGTLSGSFPAGCCSRGPSQAAAGACAAGVTCSKSNDMFELLTPLVDGTNVSAATWTNFTGNTCDGTGTDPEIWSDGGNTPLEGVLNGTETYWAGTQETSFTTWPSTSAGFAPILNDPTRGVFLPNGCDPSPTCTTNCCAGQCRPYITILLTDGAETCGGNAAGAGKGADLLLKTDLKYCTTTNVACTMASDCPGLGNACVAKRYKVVTKPIGFGIAPGDAAIEAIAHAGGAADGAGNEGYYATDEASLQLAFSQILSDAIKTELCDGADNDCDGAIDEGFNKGAACDNGQQGVCRRTGTLGCTPDGSGVQCSAVAVTPGVEICNGLDDDCDGKIDEGVSGCNCVPQGETCNNMDDDCDGTIDEGITRACGQGTCQGIETCSKGVFGGCTAPASGVEICNGLDDDCDGVKDGITQACSTQSHGFPANDPRNNQGNNPGSSPGCVAEGPAICVCHPGSMTCPANGPGMFGPCTGEVGPSVEICNGLDDDCDGTVDEGTGGANCSTNCGIGTTACVNGVITCNAMTAPNDDTCNGIDDDCDGLIDEDYVSPGACGAGSVCNGMERCINGTQTCVGDPIGTEICNCLDDDCDNTVDENVTCGAGASCTHCQCALPCDNSEFPCPLGKACVANFCIIDPCFNKDCPMVGGDKEVCVIETNAAGIDSAVCKTACSQVTCAGDLVCKPDTGACVANNCASFPDQCTQAQVCINGVCTANPCAGVTCPAAQYCVGVNGTGECHGSCVGVDCSVGQRCELGTCQADPCGHACPHGQVCQDSTSMCQADPCTAVLCPQGEWCDPHGDGTCSNDPCVGTACPSADQVCVGGTCETPPVIDTPDGEPEQHVTTGGGGGCNTGGDSTLVFGLALGLAALARRRVA